jgi:purine-nucleoside phosphorylase
MNGGLGGQGPGYASEGVALARVAAWAPDVAAVFGSGLASVSADLVVEHDIGYEELGWPCTTVPGHANRLRLARAMAAGGRELKLALACGRPHRYEGWTDAELERTVRALAGCGTRRLVLTNACGSLRTLPQGALVVCGHVVDLQLPPPGIVPEHLPVCSPHEAARIVNRLNGASCSDDAPSSAVGAYVAVLGPQFETPAEVRWLARHGAVVGMSAAPEVRAARATGVECLLLALVVNQAAAVGSHDDVLVTAGRLSGSLASALITATKARWPELA